MWTDSRPSTTGHQQVRTQYVRVKVFTERDVKRESVVDVGAAGGATRVSEVRARTIKPDRTIVELDRGDIGGERSRQATAFGEIGAYLAEIGTRDDGRTVVYTLRFAFADNGGTLLPAAAFESLKKAFDSTREQDALTLTLRAGE